MRQGTDSESPLDETNIREAQYRALNFLQTLAENLDNPRLSDAQFREFVRNSVGGMPGVDYTRSEVREEFPILPASSTGYVD